MAVVAAVESGAKIIRPKHAGLPPRAEMSLADFVRGAWHVIEPRVKLDWNWHHDAICDHLEACSAGQIQRLIITVPPGTTKSSIASVLWQPWEWTWAPFIRFLYSSHKATLATRDSVKSRRVIDSPWYQRQWRERFQLSADQNQKTRFENDRTGYRISQGLTAGVTGDRGDRVCVDDPHDAKNVESDKKREAVIEAWDGAMSTRGNDPATAVYMVIAQRTHERDLIGHILSSELGYVHLDIPAEYDFRRSVTVLGWTDPRSSANELLWPKRQTREYLDQQRRVLGSYRYAAQYQQLPVPKGGGIFKEHWFGFYVPNENAIATGRRSFMPEKFANAPRRIYPPVLEDWMQSWDMSFKAKEDSSYVVGLEISQLGPDAFLEDMDREHREFPPTLAAVLAMSQRYPKTQAKLVENKANGIAIVQTLREKIPGLITIEGNDDKVARAHAVSWYIEAGNFWLPDPEFYPARRQMVEDFLAEVTRYPNSAYTDITVAWTQILEHRIIPRALRAQAAASTQTPQQIITEAAKIARRDRW